MKIVSAHEFCKMRLCSRCETNEVSHEGELCDTCRWLLSPKKPPLTKDLWLGEKITERKELISPLKEVLDAKKRRPFDKPRKKK